MSSKKTYHLDLPITTRRELKYTRVERLEFEKRFRHFNLPGMKEILFERVFPVKPNPHFDNKPMATGGGDLEAQICLIWLGIRHNSKTLTEERVGELVDAAIAEGRSLVELLAPAVSAVMVSGALGVVYEPAVEPDEETPADPPAAEGAA